MRRGASLLLLPLLLLPAAAATSPASILEGTFDLDGTPRAGSTVTLTFTATSVLEDGALRLRVPDWVAVEGPASWTPREGESQEWRLTPTREGAWVASVRDADSGWYGACCAYGYDLGGVVGGATGQAGMDPPRLPAEADVALETVALEQGTRIVYTATARHDWMRHGALHVVVDAFHDRTEGERRDSAAAWVDVEVPDGGGLGLHVRATWRGTWESEDGGRPAVAELDCRNLQLERRGDDLYVVQEHGCMAYASPRNAAPAGGVPPPLLAVAALAAARLRRR